MSDPTFSYAFFAFMGFMGLLQIAILGRMLRSACTRRWAGFRATSTACAKRLRPVGPSAWRRLEDQGIDLRTQIADLREQAGRGSRFAAGAARAGGPGDAS